VVQAGTRLEAIGGHRWASHWWQSVSPSLHGYVARFKLRRGHRGSGRGSSSDEEPTRCCLSCSRPPLATGRQPHPPPPTLTAAMRQPPVSGAGRRLRPPRGCADPRGVAPPSVAAGHERTKSTAARQPIASRQRPYAPPPPSLPVTSSSPTTATASYGRAAAGRPHNRGSRGLRRQPFPGRHTQRHCP